MDRFVKARYNRKSHLPRNRTWTINRWHPQMDKVDGSFGAGTTRPVFPRIDLNGQPELSIGAGRRAENLPLCKGSVDSLATRPCPWPELAAASMFVCPSHVYLGKHPTLRGSTMRSCIPRQGASGIAAGCEIPAARDTPAHAYVKDCVEDSFVVQDSAYSDFGSGRSSDAPAPPASSGRPRCGPRLFLPLGLDLLSSCPAGGGWVAVSQEQPTDHGRRRPPLFVQLALSWQEMGALGIEVSFSGRLVTATQKAGPLDLD